MPVSQHRLDHRADLLATKIAHRVKALTELLKGHPLSEQFTNEEALEFWRKHRFDEIGTQIMAGWSPAQVLELDAFLARNPDEMLQGALVR